MVFKSLIRYGVPFSFVYCTIYQQNVWREGDDHLIQEQKRVWRSFFNLLDTGYQATVSKLIPDAKSEEPEKRISLLAKYDTLDMVGCWNSKVYNTFALIDQTISNPKRLACKFYRKLQPYITKSDSKIETTKTPSH